ncbi:hypothetical protein ACFX1Z_018998 [Malus domestica]
MKFSGNRETTSKEEKLDRLAEKSDIRSSIPSRMKRQAILEVNANGQLKVRRRTIIHTRQSSYQQAQEDDTEGEIQDIFPVTIQKGKGDEIPKENVTSVSFDSKSPPRSLGACSKSNEVEGGTYVASKKLHMKPTSYSQVYQSKKGQSSFRQPPKQCESVEDEEILTQRSSIPIAMRDLFPEDFFNYSVKAPCYEDCEERLSRIA